MTVKMMMAVKTDDLSNHKFILKKTRA
jgi:hypothetical protein